MPNPNAPFGLRPVGTLGNNLYSGKVQKFFVPSTDAASIGIGDPVALAGSGDADGVPTAKRMTAGGVCVGVCVGAQPQFANLNLPNYRPASTDGYILVETDPNTIFDIQESSASTSAFIAATQIGENGTLTLGTVDTTTGNGKTVLSTTSGTATTLDVQILRLAPTVGNAIGQFAKWQVRLNLNQYKTGTTGV